MQDCMNKHSCCIMSKREGKRDEIYFFYKLTKKHEYEGNCMMQMDIIKLLKIQEANLGCKSGSECVFVCF